MDKENMPAAEVASYELAFHVLPTVAEGEVAIVFQKLKDMIIKQGGVVTTEEAPARFELAYEVVKHLEGRNRKFKSAYFGWVRFTVAPVAIAAITEEIEGVKELLRHLLIKLTKTEEANPFFFHEAIASLKRVETIILDPEVSEEKVAELALEEDEAVLAAVTEEDGVALVDKV